MVICTLRGIHSGTAYGFSLILNPNPNAHRADACGKGRLLPVHASRLAALTSLRLACSCGGSCYNALPDGAARPALLAGLAALTGACPAAPTPYQAQVRVWPAWLLRCVCGLPRHGARLAVAGSAARRRHCNIPPHC